MALKELVLIAKANASGIRKVLYRNNVTSGKDEWTSDKLFDVDPDGLAEWIYDTINGRGYLTGTNVDDGWMESFYDTIAALVNNFQEGTRNQIRVDIQEHTDPDDEEVYGRLYAKIWGHGISETEIYQNLMRPAPPPPDAAFPDGWLQDLFGQGFEVMATNYLNVPGFDPNTLIGEDLTLNVRVFDNTTEELLVPWTAADQLSYQVPLNQGGGELRMEFWLNSNANGITNAYEDLLVPVSMFFAAPAFPEDWVAQYMFQKTLRVDEAFEFPVFDSSTVIGTGNLVLRVKFTHNGSDLTAFEFVEEASFTPPAGLLGEPITIVFALTDGEATANDTFLLAVQPA